MEFIYFSSFMISVNFPDQLVNDISEPVLKKRKNPFINFERLEKIVVVEMRVIG